MDSDGESVFCELSERMVVVEEVRNDFLSMGGVGKWRRENEGGRREGCSVECGCVVSE